jgi:hypothetical protein
MAEVHEPLLMVRVCEKSGSLPFHLLMVAGGKGNSLSKMLPKQEFLRNPFFKTLAKSGFSKSKIPIFTDI